MIDRVPSIALWAMCVVGAALLIANFNIGPQGSFWVWCITGFVGMAFFVGAVGAVAERRGFTRRARRNRR